jgi:hypothetical protein
MIAPPEEIPASEIEARRFAKAEHDVRELRSSTRLLINSAWRIGMRSIIGELSPQNLAGLNRALKAALAILAIDEEMKDENG